MDLDALVVVIYNMFVHFLVLYSVYEEQKGKLVVVLMIPMIEIYV